MNRARQRLLNSITKAGHKKFPPRNQPHLLYLSMLFDPSNSVFQKAVAFVNQTNRHLFLTGKAGTGKITFLKYIKEHSAKKMAVVAPTGVAAINAGGVTIHSFFSCR